METRIGRRNKIKTLVYSIVGFSILLIGYFLNRDHDKQLKHHGRYSVATTLSYKITAKNGRAVSYEFYYNSIRYTSVSDYLYDATVPGGRYLVKFSSKDPSINDIYLNQPIPEYIVVPKLGWKSTKDIK
ncbi:MAG: hypothetical protein JNL53_16490 [Cyclobacteriaceae bacterium]|nr:hypothetical protein [Cyclobacteriaceae bacterium]